MARKCEELEVVRDLDPGRLEPLTDAEASVTDGMLLNHSYADVRGCDADDLSHAISEEAAFLEEAAEVDDDPDELLELMDRYFEESELQFDFGVNAAVVAISAAGGAPISSCNGGWLGDDHSSPVPHVLFSISSAEVSLIRDAAEAADCGLINNGAHAELYANDLRKLLVFAREIQKRI